MGDPLRTVIDDGQLSIAAQPIVDLSTSAPIMDELLLRVVGPGGLPESPVELLKQAETRQAIGDLDRWVLARAAQLAATGRAVSLNVSGRTIGEGDYSACVAEMLDLCGADPAVMTFELTETAVTPDCDHAARAAVKLEALGCKLAIDDFGTGYASLTYLKRFPVHYLKIDREFVADVTSNWRSQAIVSSIVQLAENFGQQTIAEGIESSAALAALRELGVDFGQGFFIGRPQAVTDATDSSRRARALLLTSACQR
jgi:EAL domain-containing protein (putative c-di-GMP-specific phosphodiesterase class I)